MLLSQILFSYTLVLTAYGHSQAGTVMLVMCLHGKIQVNLILQIDWERSLFHSHLKRRLGQFMTIGLLFKNTETSTVSSITYISSSLKPVTSLLQLVF